MYFTTLCLTKVNVSGTSEWSEISVDTLCLTRINVSGTSEWSKISVDTLQYLNTKSAL